MGCVRVRSCELSCEGEVLPREGQECQERELMHGKVTEKRGDVNKEISVAAKMGGGDPAGHARLRTAILAARSA